jgi:hypothetical protein
VHVWLSTLLPELYSQLALANLILQQDLFSEYQHISCIEVQQFEIE